MTTSSPRSQLTARGRAEQLTARGRDEQLTARGRDELTARGRDEQLTARGRDEQLTARGRDEQLTARGRDEQLTARGRDVQLTARGRDEQLTARGRDEQLTARGRAVRLTSTQKRRCRCDGSTLQANRYSRQRGLTLIEVTIGLAIAAMVMAVGITSLNALTDANLRSAAVEITGAVKYSYDRSIMEKRIQRIGFDIDRSVWWLEYTDDPYGLNAQLARGEEGAKRDEEGNILKADDDNDLFFDSDTDEEIKRALEGGRAASFVPDGKPRSLPGDVNFDSVWTGHQEEPFRSGIGYLHFFRGGWTEPAQIVLSDGDSFITLKVSPLTGRVRMYKKKLEDGRGEDFNASEEGGRL